MVVTLPSELVTTVKPADIRGQKRFPQWLWHRVWWMPLSRSTRLHSQWRKIRIFRSSRHKNEETECVYRRGCPGMKPLRIRMVSPSGKQVPPQKCGTSGRRALSSSAGQRKTHHAFIVFGDDYQPVYISVTRKEWQVKPYVEAKKRKKKKRQGVKDKGHSYHPEPDVEEIKGLGN